MATRSFLALTVALVCLLVSSPALGEDCWSPPEHLAGVDLEQAMGIEVDFERGLAYVADTEQGVVLLDVSDFDHPVQVGAFSTEPFAPYTLAARGDLLFVGAHRLFVLDVSNPAEPKSIFEGPQARHITALALHGDYAYMMGRNTASAPTLYVYEISENAEPREIASLVLPLGASPISSAPTLFDDPRPKVRDLDVREGLALVTSSSKCLLVDVSDPGEPKVGGTFNLIGYSAALIGDLAYVTANNLAATLEVIRINGPESWERLHSVELANSGAWSVQVEGDRAYLASLYGEWAAYSLEDSTRPELLSRFQLPVVARQFKASDDAFLMAAYTDGFQIYQSLIIPEPRATENPAYALDIACSGEYAYIADLNTGVQMAKVTAPEDPEVVAVLRKKSVNAVAVYRDHLYLAAGENGLEIHDLALDDPTHRRLAHIPPVVSITDVMVADDLAFITDGGFGLRIFNVSDPGNPTPVGSLELDGFPRDVAVGGPWVYVASKNEGVHVVDASDPALPRWVTTIPGYAWNLCLFEDRLYVTNRGVAGVRIIDISNPEAPAFVTHIETPGDALAVAAWNNHLYVADSYNGLIFYDVSDPQSPVPFATGSGGWVWSAYAGANNLFAVDEDNGLMAYPGFCPPDEGPPPLESEIREGRVHLSWPRLGLGNLVGLEVVSTAYNGTEAREHAGLLAPGQRELAVDPQGRDYLRLTLLAVREDGTRQMLTSTVAFPEAGPVFESLPVYPNPFSAQATWRVVQSEAGPVRLEVYDIQGRRVHTQRAMAPGGESTLTWTGETVRGPAVDGVYFYVVESVAGRATGRLVISR